VDPFGNVLRSATVGYGRRHADSTLSALERTEQARLRVTLTTNSYASLAPRDDSHRTPLTAETDTYELLRCTPQSTVADVTNLFGLDELRRLADRAGDENHDLPYEDLDGTGATEEAPYRRLIERVRILYRGDDLTPLPLGRLEPLALPFESYKQAFTPR
jgi:hypothetical protein